jgi:hypothetical protein
MGTADEPELPPSAIRERFLAERDRMSEIFDRLLSAIRDGDDAQTVASWKDLDANVTAHLDHEQRAVLPILFEVRPRDAHGIVQEQRHIRARLREVGEAIRDRSKHAADAARSFVDELAAHLRREEALLP